MFSIPVIADFELTNIRVIAQRSLRRKDLIPYPDRIPFFVYGTAQQHHIDHVYTASPNIQASADRVTISGYTPLAGLVYAHLNNAVPESAMHPFGPASGLLKPGAIFESVKFTEDLEGSQVLGTGTLTISNDIFEDTHELNMNPEMPKEQSDGVRPCSEPADYSRQWDSIMVLAFLFSRRLILIL